VLIKESINMQGEDSQSAVTVPGSPAERCIPVSVSTQRGASIIWACERRSKPKSLEEGQGAGQGSANKGVSPRKGTISQPLYLPCSLPSICVILQSFRWTPRGGTYVH
jgi:hypothetical protein